jgi:hypothetical protein
MAVIPWPLVAALVAACATFPSAARAAGDTPAARPPSDLVKAANAPLSDVLQLRIQNTYVPEFHDIRGDGNAVSLAITMPLPKYRLLPLPQLSLLTIPAGVTTPAGLTGFGDLRFVDVAIFDPGRRVLVGVGPTFVFPTASDLRTGQGKWQAGPAAAVAFAPKRWLVGVLAQNPISFAGDRDRPDANALFLLPFVTYQLGGGWFVRSQPQMLFDWEADAQVVPIDLGVGRVFRLGRQTVSLFVEPFWNVAHEGPAPVYGITVGAAFLYPDFWRGSR